MLHLSHISDRLNNSVLVGMVYLSKCRQVLDELVSDKNFTFFRPKQTDELSKLVKVDVKCTKTTESVILNIMQILVCVPVTE